MRIEVTEPALRIEVGRFCSISTGLKFLDAVHPVDALTTCGLLISRKSMQFELCRTAAVDEFSSRFSVGGGEYPRGRAIWRNNGPIR